MLLSVLLSGCDFTFEETYEPEIVPVLDAPSVDPFVALSLQMTSTYDRYRKGDVDKTHWRSIRRAYVVACVKKYSKSQQVCRAKALGEVDIVYGGVHSKRLRKDFGHM